MYAEPTVAQGAIGHGQARACVAGGYEAAEAVESRADSSAASMADRIDVRPQEVRARVDEIRSKRRPPPVPNDYLDDVPLGLAFGLQAARRWGSARL
jgi:hypothetical protein